MKFPQKFTLILLPVTLVHLVAITLLGVVMRIDEARHSQEYHSPHFADSGIEIPHTDDLLSEGGVIESSLFPKPESTSRIIDHAEPPNADPEPLTLEKVSVNSEIRAKERPPMPQESSALPQAREAIAAPSRKPRGFRPIGVKKST